MIGIHALFGAFLMGVVMPEQNEFKEKLTARIQDVTTLILLPLFFAFTGLRTQIGLACALADKANLIVSRDLDLLRLKTYGTIGIMSPIDFLHTLEGLKRRRRGSTKNHIYEPSNHEHIAILTGNRNARDLCAFSR